MAVTNVGSLEIRGGGLEERPEVTTGDKQKTNRGQRFPARDRALGEVAIKNEDFERLKVLMDDQFTRTERRGRRTWEIAGASVTAAALFFGTALGDGVLSARTASEPQAEAQRPVLPDIPPTVEPTESASDRENDAVLPASVARAVTVVFSNGQQAGRGRHFDVRLPSTTRNALKTVGVSVPPRSASAARREQALVRGLGRLVESMGSLEAALATLRIDRELVETALDLAYGSNLEHPGRFDSFARYLPHAARRRAEGPTRRVMALAIGYDMQWPVPEAARVSSGFGPRTHPVLGQPMMHYGTDLAVEQGTVIRAMADGYVLYSKRDAVNGKFVKVDHGYGLTSAYVHNSKLLVGEGERVTQGQAIALSGATGRATGPHLHFQVELDDLPIDPEAFRERKAPRAHKKSIEAEAIGDAYIPH